jgi:hypothetical protein
MAKTTGRIRRTMIRPKRPKKFRAEADADRWRAQGR